MALADLALAPNPDEEQTGNEDAAVDADLSPQEILQQLAVWADKARMPNIAETLEPGHLGEIAMKVLRGTDIDEQSRTEWLEKSQIALDLAMQISGEKIYPWPKASNIIFPMLTEAAEQFAARAYPAIVANRNVVKGSVYGSDEGIPAIDTRTGQPVIGPDGQPVMARPAGFKRKIADQIGEHMSYQLLTEQTEWEEETDKLLNILPIVGCEFRKTYYDPGEGRNMSVRVSARNLIINYWAKSMETAPRLTERLRYYPVDIEENKRAGMWRDVEYGRSTEEDSADEDSPVEFYEQHTRLDIDKDGYPEPVIVLIAKDSRQIARITARYDVEAIEADQQDGKVIRVKPVHYYTKYDFMPSKDGGIYGQGFGQTLCPMNQAVNTTLNMLIDAGHLQNVGGGFIGKGLSIHSGTVRFKMGEYKVVNSPGGVIRDSIVTMQFPGPSPVLFQLLGVLTEAGKQISSVKDVLTGEIRAQTMSPTVFMALVEQGLKVFTAIYKRVHRSLKKEFDKLYRLNKIYLPEIAVYQVGNEERKIERNHYLVGSGVEPISDPNMVVDAQRAARAQFLMDIGANDPLIDGREVRRRALDAAQIEDIDSLLKPNPPPDPALIAKMAELELKQMEVKAAAILAMTSAIKNLAETDSIVAGDYRQWAVDQLGLMRGAIDGLASRDAGGNQDAVGGGVPGVAPPPGDQGIPPGAPGPDQAIAPGPLGPVGAGGG